MTRKLNRRGFLTGSVGATAFLLGTAPVMAWGDPVAPFPVLEAAGTPGTVGLRHGRHFKAAIGRSLAFYHRWLGKRTAQAPTQLLQEAERYARPIGQHVPDLLEEMEGIARGAGLTLADILLINARTDLLVTGRKLEPRTADTECTSFALLGRGGPTDRIALGQNWDWLPAMQENTCLLRVVPQNGPRIVTLTEAGMVGKIGMGEHRVGVCLNFLRHQSERQDAEPGVPIHVLLRVAMRCSTLEEVKRLLDELPRCASANFMAAEHRPGEDPRAWDFELAPTEMGIVKPSGRALFHTNHFVSLPLAPGCASGHGISTMNRYRQARRLVASHDKIEDPVERMKLILKDRTGAPYSISRTPGDQSETETLAAIVMDLSDNRLHVAKGPTHEHEFVSLPGV